MSAKVTRIFIIMAILHHILILTVKGTTRQAEKGYSEGPLYHGFAMVSNLHCCDTLRKLFQIIENISILFSFHYNFTFAQASSPNVL